MKLLRLRSPFIDEDLNSYIERLSKANSYPNKSIIKKQLLNFDLDLDLSRLLPGQLGTIAKLCRLELYEVYKMTVHYLADLLWPMPGFLEIMKVDGIDYPILSNEGVSAFIRKKRDQVLCPICIKNQSGSKLSWNFRMIFYCIEHQSRLVSDQNTHLVEYFDDFENLGEQASQKLWQNLWTHPTNDFSSKNFRKYNPPSDSLFHLFLAALFLIVSDRESAQFFKKYKVERQSLTKTLYPLLQELLDFKEITGYEDVFQIASSDDFFAAANLVYNISENWPHSFSEFLDLYSEYKLTRGYGVSIFGVLTQIFLAFQWDWPKLSFRKIWNRHLEDYIFERYLIGLNDLPSESYMIAQDYESDEFEQVMSISQAANLFGVQQKYIIQAIEHVVLRSVNYHEPNSWKIGYGDENNQMTIALTDAEWLFSKMLGLLPVETVASAFGLPLDITIDLFENQVLPSKLGPTLKIDEYPKWMMSVEQFQKFANNIRGLCLPNQTNLSQTIGWDLACLYLREKLATILFMALKSQLTLVQDLRTSGIYQFRLDFQSVKKQFGYLRNRTINPESGKIEIIDTVINIADHYEIYPEWIYRRIDEGYIHLVDVKPKRLEGDYIFPIEFQKVFGMYQIRTRDYPKKRKNEPQK